MSEPKTAKQINATQTGEVWLRKAIDDAKASKALIEQWPSLPALVVDRDQWKLRAERAESERDKALACVAEMRSLIVQTAVCPKCGLFTAVQDAPVHDLGCPVAHALSHDCGKGWLSPEKSRLLVEALEKIDSIATDTAKFCALPTEMQQMQDVAKRMIAAVKQP